MAKAVTITILHNIEQKKYYTYGSYWLSSMAR